MERTCQAQLLVEACSRIEPVLNDPATAAMTASQVGGHEAGRFGFQPLYDWVTRLEPDLFG